MQNSNKLLSRFLRDIENALYDALSGLTINAFKTPPLVMKESTILYQSQR